MHKLFHGGRTHTPGHINKPLPEPLVDPDEGKNPIGELVIVPIQGRDLPNRERFGKQDPFILFKLGNVSKRSSTDVRGGQRPRWKDDQINIKMYQSDAKDATSLYVTCLDEDHQKNDLIGDCVVNLQKVLDYGEHDDWFELSFKGREAGELQLQLTYYSYDPNHPTHRQNRQPTPSGPSSTGAPARRPIHPANGPAKVEHKPSASVSAATTPSSSTEATTTNPLSIHDAPTYRPPESTGPSLAVPANASGGYYPSGRISPLGHDGRVSPQGYNGRISPHGHDGGVSPSGQNGRISPSHQNHVVGGYPSPYYQQQHQMQAPSALYPPHGQGYPPTGYSGYPPQQSQSIGYPPMQNPMNQGYPPMGNAGFAQMPAGYPPSSFPPSGYPPMHSGGHVGGLYPPVQLPLQTTNGGPAGNLSMGYPPVGYPYGASNVYPPQQAYQQQHQPPQQQPQQQLVPDNYKEEHTPSGSDNKRKPLEQPGMIQGGGSSLPGAWPVNDYDRQSHRRSLEPPALPPRARSASPPALPPRN